MPFIVYEPDPFVRADICETLTTEFHGQAIAIAERLDAIAGLVKNLQDPLVVVLSVPSGKLSDLSALLGSGLKQIKTVFISDEWLESQALARHITVLPRPFSTESLLSAIRSASSDLQQDPK